MAELTDIQRDQILEALAANKKIEAIKHYRAATGEGLKEAKDFVEAIQARLHEEQPEKFPAPVKVGCGGVLLACVFSAGILTRWIFS